MLQKIISYVKSNSLVETGDRIVIGVSGGADSVCLLYVLAEICKVSCTILHVVHVNHQIRGMAAIEDEEFVRDLCNTLKLAFHSYTYDVRGIAKREGISEEDAGRKVRYQAFIETCRLYQCNKIAIAHNRNDTAETVLFNLFRGSGIKGITGIEPKRRLVSRGAEVIVIRPLLCVSRAEIEEFLSGRHIVYRTDATNLTDDYSRNRIRNHILTYAVENINTNAAEHIVNTAEQLRQINSFLESCVTDGYIRTVQSGEGCYRFSVDKMLNENIVIQKGIVRRIIEDIGGKLKDIDAIHVEQVLSLYNKQVGKKVNLPYGIDAIREYDCIRIYQERGYRKDSLDTRILGKLPVAIDGPGRYELPGLGKILLVEVSKLEKDKAIPKNSCTKWFDYDKIENAVEIRTRKTGDYLQINSSGGRKSLKDYFIDQKLPKECRDNVLLVADGSHIMWILGYRERMSEKYKIGDTTNRILSMSLLSLEENYNG